MAQDTQWTLKRAQNHVAVESTIVMPTSLVANRPVDICREAVTKPDLVIISTRPFQNIDIMMVLFLEA